MVQGWVDDQIVALAIRRRQARAVASWFAIMLAARATLPYRSMARIGSINRPPTYGSLSPKRPPLPPANFRACSAWIKKATIPFFTWLKYVDRLLAN